MKTHISLLAAALMLAACGGEEPAKPAENPAAPPAASAPSTAVHVPAECVFTVSSDDSMKFDTKEIQVKSSCKDFAITLKNAGKQPKAAMGHNLVITKAADKDGVGADGTAAGADNDYLKAGDGRVIGATKLLGGGEEDTLVLNVSKLAKGEDYVFFCTFPGHSASMNGKVVLVD
ncbi:azurin [Conchiformibius kuhniae]|uniref:Azurin n=1 Tax=Conchiformibius kuhniae TaxID=211502 RepID=A0A8T9MTQ9_9NEIS|nr:azurin [Conchiformibius kuhniae]UOP04669.1 azurin [Conchiformibius kuhniae]